MPQRIEEGDEIYDVCPECGGSGRFGTMDCHYCGGDGRVPGKPAKTPSPGRVRAEGEAKELTIEPPKKEKKTPEELASMIREDLSNVDGCPKRGVMVTVYGLNPWNAMLKF